MTLTKTIDDRHGKLPVAVWTWAFTTNGDGNAEEMTAHEVNGLIQRVVTVPDGAETPSANWDLTIEDVDGADVLGGHGLNRDSGDTGAIEQCVPEILLCAVASKLTFKVANGGATKEGTVRLYLI